MVSTVSHHMHRLYLYKFIYRLLRSSEGRKIGVFDHSPICSFPGNRIEWWTWAPNCLTSSRVPSNPRSFTRCRSRPKSTSPHGIGKTQESLSRVGFTVSSKLSERNPRTVSTSPSVPSHRQHPRPHPTPPSRPLRRPSLTFLISLSIGT